MTLPEELQAGRLRLIKDRPYLASAVWALEPVPKFGLGTLTADKFWRLYYDPEVITHWPVAYIEGILYHEICHLLRNHAERMKDYDARLSNMAADAEINDDLIREGIIYPTEPLTPAAIGQPDNLLAEEYYAALEKQEQSSSNKKKDSHRAMDKTPAPGSGYCGSCATGQPESWEDDPPVGDSESGLGQAEGELIRRNVAIVIKDHCIGQGDVPGHWLRWADDRLSPKVDWRKQLAAAVRRAIVDSAGATDYSYRRPSRRQGRISTGDVIFPSLRCPVPSVAVIADTSGSISDQMLAQTLTEISGILKATGQREGIHVLAVDQTVHFCRRVFRKEQIELAGGGGTNMGNGLEAAAKLRPLPQITIVITDGHTVWPSMRPRGMKVVVVLCGDGQAPDWANVVRLPAS